MIYKILKEKSKLKSLEHMPFFDISELNKIEKDLENLISENMLNVLFEDNALMPIYQEKPMQAKADNYALTIKGDLVIFELKRGIVEKDLTVLMQRGVYLIQLNILDIYFQKYICE